MALINDNDIKEILWQSWILWQLHRCVVVIVIFVCICNILTLQQREKPLDGRYYHIAVAWNLGRLQTVDGEDGIEWISSFCKSEHAELSFCLFAEIVAIYKEKDSSHWSVCQEPV